MRANTCVRNAQVDHEVNSIQRTRARDDTHLQSSESASERDADEILHVVVDAVAAERDTSRVPLHLPNRGRGGVNVAACVNENNARECDTNMDTCATSRMSRACANSHRCDGSIDARGTQHKRNIDNTRACGVTTIADVRVPAKQQRHDVVHELHAQRCRGASKEDVATTAASAMTTQAAAAIATTIDATSDATATVTAQRENRERSRDIAEQLEANKCECTEMNTGNRTTEACNTPNRRNSGDPASPELLVKINNATRKNLRKYEQKVRELRGYIKRADKKINNTADRDKRHAHISKQRQRSHQRSLKTALARVKRDSEITRTNSSMEAGGTARKRRHKNDHTTRQTGST